MVAPFSMKHFRMPYMDFPDVPFYEESNVILYKKPDPNEESITLFLKVCSVAYSSCAT